MTEQNVSPFQDPAKMAREEAARLHKIAFPESYEEKPEEENPEGEPQEGEPPAPDKQAEPEPEPLPEAAQAPQEGDAAYWQQRFNVMQGKYEAEVPRMAEELRELRGQLLDMASRTAPPKEETAPDPIAEAMGRIAETYGEELAQDFLQLAKAAAQSSTKESMGPVEAELAQVRTTSTKTAQQSFEDALTQRVPNWRQAYTEPGFAQFLQGNVEPLTGASYEALFNLANQNWDLERIATFFNKYNETRGITPAASPNTQTPAKATPEHLITPARRGAGMQTRMENAGGQVYTSKQIADFYQDVRDGKYRGQDQKVRQMKGEFTRAASEGRVVG